MRLIRIFFVISIIFSCNTHEDLNKNLNEVKNTFKKLVIGEIDNQFHSATIVGEDCKDVIECLLKNKKIDSTPNFINSVNLTFFYGDSMLLNLEIDSTRNPKNILKYKDQYFELVEFSFIKILREKLDFKCTSSEIDFLNQVINKISTSNSKTNPRIIYSNSKVTVTLTQEQVSEIEKLTNSNEMALSYLNMLSSYMPNSSTTVGEIASVIENSYKQNKQVTFGLNGCY